MSRTGSWALNPDTGGLLLSREMYPLLGIDSEQGPLTYPMVVARVHPDDRDRIDASIRRAIQEGAAIEGENRIVLPDGSVTRLHFVGHPVGRGDSPIRVYAGMAEEMIPTDDLSEKMTPREREIVQLVAEARSTKEIAFQLGISAKTVEGHRTNIMRKLGVRCVSEIVRFAIRNGMVKP